MADASEVAAAFHCPEQIREGGGRARTALSSFGCREGAVGKAERDYGRKL